MQGDVIKSFLVGLGFDVDESSLAAFNKSIATAALRVTALYSAVNAFAGSMVYAFSKISEGFEEMGYQYHIIAPAINKAIILRQELLKAYGAAGINIRKVIVDSVHLNMSLAKTRFAMEAIYKSVGSKFFGLLQKQSDMFRKKLYENMPYIIGVLTKLVKAVFKAFEIITVLGARIWSILTRVYDFFKSLDEATDGWSTKILGVIAAWKLLNLEFLATPLGALLAGLLALLAVFDDFKTYQEGGKSLFNWGPAIPIIEQVTKAVLALKDALVAIVKLAIDFVSGEGWSALGADVTKIAEAFERVDAALDAILRKLGGDTINKLLNFRDKVDKGFFGLFGSNGQQPPQAFTGSPLGGSTTNAQTNINANMQTSINVVGSPNAAATGQLIASGQQNVNRDLVRNLKGSIA